MKKLNKAEKVQMLMIILVVTVITAGGFILWENTAAIAQTPASSPPASIEQSTVNTTSALFTQEEANLFSFSPVPDTTIRLKATDNKWACATGIEAETYKEQLDEKIAYVEACYSTKKAPFLITEDITLAEVTNTAGIAYMYANSLAYREMAELPSIQAGYGNGTFYKYGDKAVSYQRLVKSLQTLSEINIDVFYALDKGELSVWVVSPDGEIVFQTAVSSTLKEQIVIDDAGPGLWSIIVVNYFDENCQLSGQLNLQVQSV